jgi:hypothetical protein
MAMPRVDHCAQTPRPFKKPALVVCKSCLKLHTVHWEHDWRMQLKHFLDEHQAAHDRYAFDVIVQ